MSLKSPVKDKPQTVLFVIPKSKWDDAHANSLNEAQKLLYRSNLLGSDLTITNFGGGNTSAKIIAKDPLTNKDVETLWVKGSGGDIGSMKMDGFAALYLDKLLALEGLYEGPNFEDKMVDYLPHCAFNLNPRAASIDTPLHAYLPFAHIDHLHPDSIIALAASNGGKAAALKLWGGKIGWLEWQRPGFDLGLKLRDLIKKQPNLKGVVLEGHGIIAWGDTAKECYENSLGLIIDAANFLNNELSKKGAFGGAISKPLSENLRIEKINMIAPKLRGLMSKSSSKIAHFSDTEEVLEFVSSRDFLKLAALGTSCPDHFLRTKIKPLCLEIEKLENENYLGDKIEEYRNEYKNYYDRCASSKDPKMRDANPIVVLIPQIGMLCFAHDKTTARLAAEFYINAINVMRGAQVIGDYIGLDEKEAFKIEYWALEEAKLQRMPKPKPLEGKIAFITGGAGGIGVASARKLLQEGACVMIADRDGASLKAEEAALINEFGRDRIKSALCDVTSEAQIKSAFESTIQHFGGLDILVANAGIASSASVEETSTELWRKNYDVLVEGYFLASREAFGLMKQANGGSIIFIGSKNAIAATPNASAYASAKAASLHLARCLALEGAPFGIRVNVVNPDAVIKGSRIWSGEWRKERASTHGIDSGEELEAHYRNRSMLKLDVLPQDVAQSVYFFASDMSAKSTGNMLNVDAGNAQAFPR